VQIDPLNDPRGALAQRSVYFDYDSYVVRGDGRPVVENHAAYLGKNKNRRIIIQGNTDERGGTEYNLALGQKRAEAVRKSLTALGVADTQMEAVSLGENKPAATGANETSWAKNRRADIVY
jgi:peptidoglycan-associated lipoprotein